jgi:hypothetical protein
MLSHSTEVIVLPSEAAQHLANHIFMLCGTIFAYQKEMKTVLDCTDAQDLAQIIQDYWDSLL